MDNGCLMLSSIFNFGYSVRSLLVLNTFCMVPKGKKNSYSVFLNSNSQINVKYATKFIEPTHQRSKMSLL